MVFSSNIFLFGFLPLFLGLYFLLPFRRRSALILVASYIFYGWWDYRFVALMFASTLLDYHCGRSIEASDDACVRKRWLRVSVVANLSVLGFFKYYDFFALNLAASAAAFGLELPLPLLDMVLPIGISFYTLQSMGYSIDIYRGHARPAGNFLDFAAFVAFFPQLVAGPILRHTDLAPQFRQRTHSFDSFSAGAARFMTGFAKKVLLADALLPLSELMFAQSAPSFCDAWIGNFAASARIYIDFAAYSDIAIGLGMMLGFRIPENFRFPYLARSMSELWQRWHISLTGWLIDYLYIPLGGSRRGVGRTVANIVFTFLICGLWHGASWTFVIWGGLHGALLCGERWLRARGVRDRLPEMLKPLRTLFIWIVIGVFFRAPDLEIATGFYRGMIGLHGFALSDALAWQVTGLQLTTLCAAYLMIFVEPFWRSHLRPRLVGSAWLPAGAAFAVFLLAVVRLAARGYEPFLYYQF